MTPLKLDLTLLQNLVFLQNSQRSEMLGCC